LFFKWSGVGGGDNAGEEGARVGEEALLGGGMEAGSRSLSGIGDDSTGRRVMRNNTRRRIALRLNYKSVNRKECNYSLDTFQGNYTSPPDFERDSSSQAHFDK
jgi:hypothetical protein